MVWVALIYSALGSFITHRLGKPLVTLANDEAYAFLFYAPIYLLFRSVMKRIYGSDSCAFVSTAKVRCLVGRVNVIVEIVLVIVIVSYNDRFFIIISISFSV